MAKSKIQKKHSLSAKGVLDATNLTLEVEEFVDLVSLQELLQEFDGKNIKISVNVSSEVTE